MHGNDSYSGYQDLYDAVRKGAEADNIVLVAGLDYGYKLDFVNATFEVEGTNIVYCAHPYNDKGEASGAVPYEKNFAGIKGRYPIIFTEFGSNDSSAFPPSSNNYQGMYERVFSYINNNDIHWTGFEWFVDKAAAPSLISDWKGTPQCAGNYVKGDLQKNPPPSLNK